MRDPVAQRLGRPTSDAHPSAAALVRRWRAGLDRVEARPLLGRVLETEDDLATLELSGAQVGDLVAFGPPWPTSSDQGRWGEVVALRDGAALVAPDGGVVGLGGDAFARRAPASAGAAPDPALLWGRRGSAWGAPIGEGGAGSESAPPPIGSAAWPRDARVVRVSPPRRRCADDWIRALFRDSGCDRLVALFLGLGAVLAAERCVAGRVDALAIAAGPDRADIERLRAVRTAHRLAIAAAKDGSTLFAIDDAAAASDAVASLFGARVAVRRLASIAESAGPELRIAFGDPRKRAPTGAIAPLCDATLDLEAEVGGDD